MLASKCQIGVLSPNSFVGKFVTISLSQAVLQNESLNEKKK